MARDRRVVMLLIAGLVMAAGWRDASLRRTRWGHPRTGCGRGVEEPGTHKGGGRTIGYSLIDSEN
jgi:hypothetical protein